MWNWVMQEFQGHIFAVGKYKSEEAADNRMKKIHGGEVHLFRSDTANAESAISEFRQERVNIL